MGFFDGYDIATSGMSAQRTRINVVSANIANAKTTHTADGTPYRKQQVVFKEVLMNQNKQNNSLSNNLNLKNTFNNNKNISTVQNNSNKQVFKGVGVDSIVKSNGEPIMKYEPEHPDANENGYVAYPNINPVVEMVDLMEAMRSYEANVAAFNTHKNIDSKTLDILTLT